MKNIVCLIFFVAMAMATTPTEVTETATSTTDANTTEAAPLVVEQTDLESRKTCNRINIKYVQSRACRAYCRASGFKTGRCTGKKTCACTRPTAKF